MAKSKSKSIGASQGNRRMLERAIIANREPLKESNVVHQPYLQKIASVKQRKYPKGAFKKDWSDNGHYNQKWPPAGE